MIKFHKSLLFLLKTSLFLILCTVFIASLKIADLQLEVFNKEDNIVFIFYAILLFIFIKIYGGFKVGVYRSGELKYSNCIAIIMSNIIMYFQLSWIGHRFLEAMPILLATTIQFIFIMIGCNINNKIYFKIYSVRDVVAICSNKDIELDLINKMNYLKEKYKVQTTIKDDMPLAQIKKVIDNYSSVLLCDIDDNIKKQIINYCYKTDTRLYILPDVEEIIVNNADHVQILDTPVFLCKNRGLSPEQQFIKRVMDIVVSVIGLALTSPIMVIVAIAIKLQDGGPIFFKQQRVTKDNKLFYVLKFRSMVVDAEKDGVARLATKSDSRITSIGKVIRMTRLDELPQFINILKGEMSLVGPRPERPEIMADYIREWPEIEYRTKVKAGLTGLAQVRGKYNTTPQDKLAFDLLYIERYSLWLDIKLILMTIKILFMRESTEGVSEGAITAMEQNAVEFK